MKPFLERLRPAQGASWAMLNRRLDEGIPFQWHHHPEFELTLTLNSRGQRFIGDNIGDYEDGDLVLVGSNLPHTWSSSGKVDPDAPHVALVVWFPPGWAEALGATFVELKPVAAMLERAAPGLQFSGDVAKKVRPMIEALFRHKPDEGLPDLIAVLSLLARDADAKPLASRKAIPGATGADRTRIDRVLDHIHLNYASGLSVTDLADIAALSPSGLHRLFRRHTQLTLSDYIIRLKIGEACAMLMGTAKPVAHIAQSVGYNSLANFNRQFKALRGVTPRAYRNGFP